jgi:hypothetical protein
MLCGKYISSVHPIYGEYTLAVPIAVVLLLFAFDVAPSPSDVAPSASLFLSPDNIFCIS